MLELNYTREDVVDSPNLVTPRNIEVAASYALRTARSIQKRLPVWMDKVLFEEALIMAVLRAAENYDPNDRLHNGASFFTYCHSMVRGAIKEEFRRQHRHPQEHSSENLTKGYLECTDHNGMLHGGSVQNSGHGQHLLEASQPDCEQQAALRGYVRYILNDVAPRVLLTQSGGTDWRAINILVLRYLMEMKQKDVARLYRVTPGRIHQIEDLSLGKLRAALVESGELPSV